MGKGRALVPLGPTPWNKVKKFNPLDLYHCRPIILKYITQLSLSIIFKTILINIIIFFKTILLCKQKAKNNTTIKMPQSVVATTINNNILNVDGLRP